LEQNSKQNVAWETGVRGSRDTTKEHVLLSTVCPLPSQLPRQSKPVPGQRDVWQWFCSYLNTDGLWH